MKKFQQVSTDGHQMSLVGGKARGGPCPKSVGGGGPIQRVMVTQGPPTCRQND